MQYRDEMKHNYKQTDTKYYDEKMDLTNNDLMISNKNKVRGTLLLVKFWNQVPRRSKHSYHTCCDSKDVR
jgi:hypothetical protein